MIAKSDSLSGVKYLALSGGVGGAKLALGISNHIDPETLAIAANVGDDFEYLGLNICPDIDTLTYTLAGLNNPKTGWGRSRDTFNFMKAVKSFNAEAWFQLGDQDLALHILRTQRLRSGEKLSSITRQICNVLGVKAHIIPASDDPIKTKIETINGNFALQHYFVRENCQPKVTGFKYEGSNKALAKSLILEKILDIILKAVILCPSKPYISIDPILAIRDFKQALKQCKAPIVAVSPVVGRHSLKGPTAKMMEELGYEVNAHTIACHYGDIIDGIVIDSSDFALERSIEDEGIRTCVVPTIMISEQDKIRLAQDTLNFAATFSS